MIKAQLVHFLSADCLHKDTEVCDTSEVCVCLCVESFGGGGKEPSLLQINHGFCDLVPKDDPEVLMGCEKENSKTNFIVEHFGVTLSLGCSNIAMLDIK